MKRVLICIFVFIFIISFSNSPLFAQMDLLYGTDNEYKMGEHSGKKFDVHFLMMGRGVVGRHQVSMQVNGL